LFNAPVNAKPTRIAKVIIGRIAAVDTLEAKIELVYVWFVFVSLLLKRQ
jgi:hypothetical protein